MNTDATQPLQPNESHKDSDGSFFIRLPSGIDWSAANYDTPLIFRNLTELMGNKIKQTYRELGRGRGGMVSDLRLCLSKEEVELMAKSEEMQNLVQRHRKSGPGPITILPYGIPDMIYGACICQECLSTMGDLTDSEKSGVVD